MGYAQTENATQLGNVGGVLGDYQIIREIGRGGMGVVYEAEQLSLKRRVALKVLPFAALLDQRQLERFQTEARAAAMLKHPNIVSVHAVGYDRGVHHYAMELIDGQSLAESIRGEPRVSALIPLDIPEVGASQETHDMAAGSDVRPSNRGRFGSQEQLGYLREIKRMAASSTQHPSGRKTFFHGVARLGIQAAEALQYAHDQGVIHRDIKPSNLLLDRDGRLHIADFGLARIQAGGELTTSGDMVGTLRYMSPEQLDGESVVDQRTDVYSLGLTLYEVISGGPAFTGQSRSDLVRQILASDVKPLRQVDATVPKDLGTIVHKAVAKSRDERYGTASELADDLQRFLDNRPVKARPA